MGKWSASELIAWISAVGAAIALASQVWGFVKKNREDRAKINSALDRSPEVKQQLALGNVGEALTHLNTIIETQNKHMEVQAKRLEASDREIEQAEVREAKLQEENQGLRENNRRLIDASLQIREEASTKEAALQAEIEELKKTFARALRQGRPTTEQEN